MKRMLIMVSFLAAASAAAAPPPAKTFSQLDRNRDGGLSRDETLPAGSLLTRFSDLDKDHDGVLSSDEFAAFEAAPGRAPPPVLPAEKTDKPVGQEPGRSR